MPSLYNWIYIEYRKHTRMDNLETLASLHTFNAFERRQHWQNYAYATQDEDKKKNTTQ